MTQIIYAIFYTCPYHQATQHLIPSPTSSFLHLLGFESSLINFTCPHSCPQLFIGPYYENLNLLFDYGVLPPEACGFWCIIEQTWSHKWLLHTRIKVWVFPNVQSSDWGIFSPPFLSVPRILPERLAVQSYSSPVHSQSGEINSQATLQYCNSLFLYLSMATLPTVFF